jgi:hypothetical protein
MRTSNAGGLNVIARDCPSRRVVNPVMYFSEIDLFPRSEGRGLNLALAKHCAILVSRTTFFSGKVRRRAGLQRRVRRSRTKKSAAVLPKYRNDSDTRTLQIFLFLLSSKKVAGKNACFHFC